MPTLQIAHMCSYLLPTRESADVQTDGDGDGAETTVANGGWVRVRRLRVVTIQLPLARTIRQLYEAVDDRVLMLLLVHKVIAAIENDGFREGRLLLQDWLVMLLSKYQVHYQAHPDSILHPEQMCPALASVPKFVYSLLVSPLLSSNTPLSSHQLSADARTSMYTLYRNLPTHGLAVAIRCKLAAYSDPQKLAQHDLPLTRHAMRSCSCPLFVLDAYTHIWIYLDAEQEVGFSFPPSKSTAIWRDAISTKQQRLRGARITCCQSGTSAGDSFESYIEAAEAPPVGGDSSSKNGQGRFSFREFTHFIHKAVSVHLV